MFAYPKSVAQVAWVLTLVQLSFLAAIFCPSQLAGQGRTDTLASSGQAAPGGNGTFEFFEGVYMNHAGEVSFFGALAGTTGGSNDNAGIFRANGTSTIQLVRVGQSAPGGNGVFSNMTNNNRLNNMGQLAFTGFLTGTSGGASDNSGIFRSDGTSLVQIARRGQTALGLNGTFSFFAPPVLNQVGQTAFYASLSGTSAGTNDDEGVFRGDGSFMVQIAREGQAAPDGNGTLSSFGPVSINNAGVAAFRATLNGTNGGASDYSGIFAGSGGNLTQIVRGNQAAPGNGVFADFNFSNQQSFNNVGQAAFYAILSGTVGGASDDRGVYRSSGGPVTQIAREGQAAPDGNGMFENFGDVSLNDAGQVAFQASLTGTSNSSNDNSGVFRGSGGTLTQVAREGQLAADGNGFYGTLSDISIGGGGQVIFRSSLIGTVGGSSDNTGLYVGDGTDLLQVVREGDAYAGSSVLGFNLETVGATNQHGQVAYRAFLANGNEVVSRWTPELHWRTMSSSSWDTAGRWTLGLTPAAVHDVFIDPAASLTVTGPASDVAVRSLHVGGGTGLATLSLRNGAVLSAVNGVTVQSTGTLTGDGVIAASVTNNGTIIANNVTIQGTLTNNRTIQGTGRIHATINNSANGRIRVLGRNEMWLSGPSINNNGLIEINQSELTVDGTFINRAGTGLMSLQNASLVANAGVSNAGSIAMTLGNSSIQGDINNTGIIQVSGGAHATFFGDVNQNGTFQVAAVGNTLSAAVILGSFTGSGGFVGGGDLFALGDLRPGNSPASVLYDGNLFLGAGTQTHIEIGGLGVSDFDQMLITGNLNLAGDLHVSMINGHTLGVDEFYLIGEIGGNLLGNFAGLSEGSLIGNFGGRELFITYVAGDGNDIGLFTAVPEPGAAVLLIGGLATLVLSRRKRTYTVKRFSSVNRKSNCQLRSKVRSIIFLVATMTSIPASLLAQPTVTNLGVLPNGSLSIANAMSADGSTVTGYSNFGQFTNPRAFRWTAGGGMQDLGVLPGYSSSIGNAVNFNGSVVVGGGSGFTSAWRWTASTGMQDLGTLAGGPNSAANGISADGSTVIGWSQAGGTQQRPFRWTAAGGLADLGVLAGGSAGIATAISGNGLFIAGATNYAGSGSETHAVRWTESGIQDLGAIAGSAQATAISHDGSVVVGWTATNNGTRAFRWTESEGMVNLGVPFPPGTFPTSDAWAVSGDGLTIGGSWFGGNSAFFWREDLGPVDFKTWLTAEGADTSGWVFSRITGLSYDGSIISGTGFFENQQRAWIVNLNSVPEPGSGLLIGLASCWFASRRRRHV